MDPLKDLDDGDGLREVTRELRRTIYLAEALEAAAADVSAMVASAPADAPRALKAVLHLHLTRAWDDGAGREADLRSALAIAQVQVDRLKRQVKELLRRISAER